MPSPRPLPLLAQIAPVDWAVLVLYLLGTLAIGWWAMRKIKDAGGFLLAERRLGKLMSMAATFAGGVNAQDPINIASKTYAVGLSGIWVSLQFLLLTPWMWIVAPVGRRTRCVTTLDMIRMRMGRPVEMLNFFWGLLTAGFGVAVGLKAAVIAVVATSGGAITEHQAAALIILPTIAYCLMGGILAVCATDVFMSILILVLSFLLIPFAIVKLGGLEAVSPPTVPITHFELLSADGISWVTLFWFVMVSIPAIGGVNPSGAINEVAARVGTLGLVFKRFCTVGWAAIGLFAVAMFGVAATSGIKPDEVFPLMSARLLPDGLRGVMVASVLAAVMSTVAGGMINFAGNVLNNFYRPFVRPNASPREYLLVARLCAAANILLGWAVLSVVQQDIVDLFLTAMSLNAVWGLPLLLCFLWRRVTAYGAVAGAAVLVTVFIFNNIVPYATSPAFYRSTVQAVADGYTRLGETSVQRSLDRVHRQIAAGEAMVARGEALRAAQPALPPPSSLPVVTTAPAGDLPTPERLIKEGQRKIATAKAPEAIAYPLYLIPGLVVTVLVSLLTPQHNAKVVREFYARLDTPVGREQDLRDQGIQVDLIEDIGGDVQVDKAHGDIQRRLLLLDLLYLPGLIWRRQVSWKDYWVDLAGIGASVAFIVLFVLGLYGLTRIFV